MPANDIAPRGGAGGAPGGGSVGVRASGEWTPKDKWAVRRGALLSIGKNCARPRSGGADGEAKSGGREDRCWDFEAWSPKKAGVVVGSAPNRSPREGAPVQLRSLPTACLCARSRRHPVSSPAGRLLAKSVPPSAPLLPFSENCSFFAPSTFASSNNASHNQSPPCATRRLSKTYKRTCPLPVVLQQPDTSSHTRPSTLGILPQPLTFFIMSTESQSQNVKTFYADAVLFDMVRSPLRRPPFRTAY